MRIGSVIKTGLAIYGLIRLSNDVKFLKKTVELIGKGAFKKHYIFEAEFKEVE